MTRYELSAEEEERTMHFYETTSNEEIAKIVSDMCAKRGGTMYYDIGLSTDNEHLVAYGTILQMAEYKDGKIIMDEDGIVLSGKHDMYYQDGCLGKNIDMNTVIAHIQNMCAAIKESN